MLSECRHYSIQQGWKRGDYLPPGAGRRPARVEVGGVTVAEDGWIAAGETWTYDAADSPSFTFTVSGDQTTKYTPGTRIQLTQTTVKYFIVTKVAFAANTTVTIYGGTDYTLVNAAITSPYFSRQKAPAGFPLDPSKWTASFTSTDATAQASPSANTWYNLSSALLLDPNWHLAGVLSGVRIPDRSGVLDTLYDDGNTVNGEQLGIRHTVE